MDFSYIQLHFVSCKSSIIFQISGVLNKNKISINKISPGEEQINKQTKYHPYDLDVSYIQLHLKFHANPSVSDLEGFKEISIIN